MGRRQLAIGMSVCVLAMLAYQVWAGGDAADTGKVVAMADRPRGARMLPAVLARVTTIEVDDTPGDLSDDGDEVPALEPGAEVDDHINDDGEVVDDDGLTLDQRIEGQVADAEDQLPLDRGAVHGRVRDDASGEDLVGVTVVISGRWDRGQGEQVAITDEHGVYLITNLLPGHYRATFYYVDVTVERGGVEVAAGATTPVFQRIPTATERPRVFSDLDGISISSNCGSTNTYVIDGIETDDTTETDDKLDPDNAIDPDEETIE